MLLYVDRNEQADLLSGTVSFTKIIAQLARFYD